MCRPPLFNKLLCLFEERLFLVQFGGYLSLLDRKWFEKQSDNCRVDALIIADCA